MLKNLFLCFGAAVLLGSCANHANKTAGAASSDPTKDGKHFGAIITPDHAITYDALMPKMATVDSMPAKVTGKVSGVCQKKGCWMTLTSDQPGKPDMRVTFKDYAFFMPKDLAGKKVVIDGYAYVETTPVAELRHYAEDAGKSKAEVEAITKPKRELAFEAKGVVIVE
ncbi:MAG: DUF4920 domain-containing protein [Bacteroidota bacterium]